MKTILITGAAKGIGKETAILFGQKGWRVAAAVRNVQEASELGEIGNICVYPIDVRDRDSIDRCIESVIKDFGTIDVIVNNAGIYTTNPLETTPDKTIDNLIATNINGTLNMTKAIVKHFRENKSGTIVNIASVAGRVTFPYQSVYHASKWAIEGFSEGLRYELKRFNIKVRVVEPGMVRTNLYDSQLSIPLDKYPTDYKNNFSKWHSSLLKNYVNGYNPALDAKTIYRAVNDRGAKLRYTSDFTTRMLFFLRSILPLSAFQSIVYKVSKLE